MKRWLTKRIRTSKLNNRKKVKRRFERNGIRVKHNLGCKQQWGCMLTTLSENTLEENTVYKVGKISQWKLICCKYEKKREAIKSRGYGQSARPGTNSRETATDLADLPFFFTQIIFHEFFFSLSLTSQ